MDLENEKKLIVKFPEIPSQQNGQAQQSSGGTLGGQPPTNSVEKTADFIPRALLAIKGNFRESVYLLVILGYIFIAVFGHMEKFQNYLGYFFVMAVGIIIYIIWEKIFLRDIIYIIIIVLLSSYLIFINFGIRITNWFK